MQHWNGLAAAPAGFGPSAVTIGVFDGVHRGHQRIVGATVAAARAAGMPAAVLTFTPHPIAVLRPGSEPAVLTPDERKAELLAGLGVDVLCTQPFTTGFSHLEPEQFVRAAIVDAFHARQVVVGENFRFGHRAAGDVARLRELGGPGGFEVLAVPLAGAGDQRWSSTYARDRLVAGDVAAAADVLGRPHRLTGTVVHGDHRGRELGYPTANLALAPGLAVPADGVYAGWLLRADRPGGAAERLPAAISVGTNPTFDGHQCRVEAYAIDVPFEALDLYGEEVGVEFTDRLRGQERFPDADALIRQMALDVDAARARLGTGG